MTVYLYCFFLIQTKLKNVKITKSAFDHYNHSSSNRIQLT